MKKFAALLLGSAMLVSAFAGLAACKPDDVPPDHTEHVDVDPKDGKCDVCGKDMSPGTTDHSSHPDADLDGKCDIGEEALKPNDPVPSITLKDDPRAADAYTVHGPDGEVVGSCRTLSEAIDAAIENDLDLFEDTQAVVGMKGSYVTLKGSEEKLFRNQRGFSATKGDVYYYYENGALTGVEAVDSTVNHALNKEWVNYRVTQGVYATQPQNGYKLLDGKGEIIKEPGFSASSREWEFYAFSDASIRATPTRDRGATGSRYTVDLSDVKIAPPYKGVENKTYAFLGFVVQARQYVFELGIACDTSTGNWYTYCSHSPGQKSLVFNNYDLGELVMSSSWNAEGGYFTPACGSVEFEIMEKRGVDEFDEAVFYNEMTIKAGEKELFFHIDSDFIGAVSAGSAFDVRNGFVFVAGLDIVEKDSEAGDDLAIADYTNGSYFKDLAITKSEIYFPTDEEAEGGDYQGEVDEERKGKWFSTYADFDGLQKGVYDYTIVNSAAFVDYSVTAEKSVWSFSYEYEPVSEPFAGEVKEYMQKIGSLKDITAQNVAQYKGVIAELNAAYANGKVENSTLDGFIYYALDWELYLGALEVYNKALADTMGPDARQIVEDLGKLPALGFFKGYRAPDPLPEGAAATDYLYNAVMEVFKQIADRFRALPLDQQEAFGYSAASYIYQEWEDLYTELSEALTGDFGKTSYTVANPEMTSPETLTGAQIIESLFDCAFNVGYTPKDGEKVHTLYAGGGGVYEARASFRILFFRAMLEENEVFLNYLDKVIDLLCEKVAPDAYDGAALIADFENYLYPVMGQIVRILKGECTWLDGELAKVINGNMVNYLSFNDPCLRYNIVSRGGNIDGGNFALYFGETEVELPGASFRKILEETIYELIRRDSPDTVFSVNSNYQYVASEVTALSEDPYNALSENCKEVISALKEFANIADLSTLMGDGEAVLTGLTQFEALQTKYNALGNGEQGAVARYAYDPAEMFDAYRSLKAELDGLDNSAATIGVKALTDSGEIAETAQLTKRGVVEEFIKAALTADEQKGLLCLGDRAHAVRTFRAYYLYKLIEEQNIESAFVDEVIAYFEADTTEIGKRFKDLTYFFAVGGQIARIRTKTVRYLDQAMADVVNAYMADHAGANGGGQGTWCEELSWWYTTGGTTGNGACGRFNDACTFAWAHYIADGLYGGSYETWGTLMNYIGKILDRDAPGSTVMLGSNAGVYSLMTTQTVSALSADPTENLPKNIRELIEGLESLADITDLFRVESGEKVLEGLASYAELKATYDGLADGDKTTVALMAYDPAALFAAYEALAGQIGALDNARQITVKTLTEAGEIADPTQMTAQAIAKEFIRCALGRCANGYFCLSHNGEKEGYHVPKTMRAYYLYTLMKEEGIGLDFADEIVNAIKADGYGKDAWDAVSTVWPVLGQVARIVSGEVSYLDKEMAEALNAALENRTSVTFAVGDWNGWWYDQGDINTASRFVWTYYIDDVFVTWTPLPELMERLGTVIDTYGNGVKLEKTGKGNYGFKLSGHLTGLDKDPMTDVSPEVEAFIAGARELADITDLSKAESGEKVLEGLASYAELKAAFDGFDALKQAQAKAALPHAEALLAAYHTLSVQLAALGTEKISVKTLNGGTTAADFTPADPKDMTKAEIVREFIGLSLTKCAKHGKYICAQCDLGAADAFRAYYLYTLVKDEDVTLISSIATYVNTASERRWDDIAMLFAALKQVARIMNHQVTYLDAEMADMINNYLVDRTGAWSEGGTAFYYGDAWCWEYRTNGDLNKECKFAWTTYIDDVLYSEGWKPIPEFMAKLAEIIERDGAGVKLLKATNQGKDTEYYGFKVSGEVIAVDAPQE